MNSMKKLSLFLTLVCFATSYGQETHKATLICNLAALNSETPAYEACYFSEQQPGTDTREFTIYVKVGDIIEWDGMSTDGEGAIDIKKIKYESGTNVFNKPEIDGVTTVVGTVRQDTEGKPEYKYKISFKVNDTGRMYSIDPKVAVRP